jgi:hypothetical protein
MDIKLELVLQEPINFYGLTVYQYSLKEISTIGFDYYNSLLLPYLLTWELLNIPEDKVIDLKYFDILMVEQDLFDSLIKSLCLFCKTDNIKIQDENIFINDFILNRDNFDEFGQVILDINSREKPKIEKPPVFANDRQKDIWEKLQEGRKKNKKKEELQLCDILNIVEFGGKFHIPIETIKTWTLWKIMNAYKSILEKDNYDSSFSVYLVSGETKLIEKHWTQQIRVS